IGIRTPTNRVRVCRAAVTQFRNLLLPPQSVPLRCLVILTPQKANVKSFFVFFGARGCKPAVISGAGGKKPPAALAKIPSP
ncbi:MAG: hypothetical protein IKX92_05485, partial [Clostridia bacterium]|nr:hypothetical protein [Clostridia bacterium]